MNSTEAALSAARQRSSPIVMTAMTFIIGVLSLVFATGAGMASRQVIGTVVVGGCSWPVPWLCCSCLFFTSSWTMSPFTFTTAKCSGIKGKPVMPDNFSQLFPGLELERAVAVTATEHITYVMQGHQRVLHGSSAVRWAQKKFFHESSRINTNKKKNFSPQKGSNLPWLC